MRNCVTMLPGIVMTDVCLGIRNQHVKQVPCVKSKSKMHKLRYSNIYIHVRHKQNDVLFMVSSPSTCALNIAIDGHYYFANNLPSSALISYVLSQWCSRYPNYHMASLWVYTYFSDTSNKNLLSVILYPSSDLISYKITFFLPQIIFNIFK